MTEWNVYGKMAREEWVEEKNKILNENWRGGSKRGRGRFPEPDCPPPPGSPARCPHSRRGDEQSSSRLTGLWWGVTESSSAMRSGSAASSGRAASACGSKLAAQTSRIWTAERRREDCRCRNNVNKGLEAGSTHIHPGVGLGAQHREHGTVMNKDQLGDRS